MNIAGGKFGREDNSGEKRGQKMGPLSCCHFNLGDENESTE